MKKFNNYILLKAEEHATRKITYKEIKELYYKYYEKKPYFPCFHTCLIANLTSDEWYYNGKEYWYWYDVLYIDETKSKSKELYMYKMRYFPNGDEKILGEYYLLIK